MKKIFKITKGNGIDGSNEEVIYDAMDFINYFFDDEKYFDEFKLFKKNYKIIVEIK